MEGSKFTPSGIKILKKRAKYDLGELDFGVQVKQNNLNCFSARERL